MVGDAIFSGYGTDATVLEGDEAGWPLFTSWRFTAEAFTPELAQRTLDAIRRQSDAYWAYPKPRRSVCEARTRRGIWKGCDCT